MISRRHVLGAAAILPLAAPSLAAPESDRVMRFIPQSELNSIDPAWIPAANVRTHGYLVFDTLYGIDGQYKAQPQMVEGASVENDDGYGNLGFGLGSLFTTARRFWRATAWPASIGSVRATAWARR